MWDLNRVLSYSGISVFSMFFARVFSSVTRVEVKELVEDKLGPMKEQTDGLEGRVDKIDSTIDRLEDKIDRLPENLLKLIKGPFN